MLSDILKPRITELGSIRIGKKGEERKGEHGTYRLPQKLDHFIITKLTRNDKDDLVQDTELMNDLAAQGYGDSDGHLRRIPIRVLSNDPEDILQASFCWYAGKKIGARSDGRRVTFFMGASQKDWLQPLKPPHETDWSEAIADMKDGKGNKLFKIHATFNCMIASKSARFGGVYKFRTTSKITADQLYGGLGNVLQLTNGILMGMPLELCIRPIQVTPETTKGQITTKVYIVHVELIGDDLRAIQQQANEQARFMLETTDSTKRALALYRKVLRTPGDEIDALEIADIQQEFHPDEDTDETTDSFPMPKPTDDTPPVTTDVEDPTTPPPPPVEEAKPEEKPKKRGRKKKDTIEIPPGDTTTVNKPVEQPKVEEKPETVLPKNTDPELTPRQLAEQGWAHWKGVIDNVKSLEQLQEMKAPGHPFVAFYQACQADKFNDIANEALERAKGMKLGLLRRAIEDIYMADDWTDKAVKDLAKSIGIPNIDNMDALQAEKLLAKMSENRKGT